MGRSSDYCVMLLLLCELFCSGSSSRTNKQSPSHGISTTKRDITTPITTVPNLVPTIPTAPSSSSSSSSSSSPILNPNSSPDTFSPASTLPFTNNTTSPLTPSNSSSGVSWCIASPSASLTALQVALDYACGYGGVDCSEIQPGGRCYIPPSLRNHASVAFNSYYQTNPVPNSCNFGGTALITSTNPSSGTCQYPSTSTSSTVLNTTNSMGANVFGSVPVPMSPSSPSAAPPTSFSISFTLSHICVILWVTSFLATTSL